MTNSIQESDSEECLSVEDTFADIEMSEPEPSHKSASKARQLPFNADTEHEPDFTNGAVLEVCNETMRKRIAQPFST